MTEHRFQTLDVVRGVAAFAVLGHHLELRAGWGTHFLSHGYLAVDLFFMLSGFVIGYAYERRLMSGLPFREFAQARVIRLYPIIALGAVLGLIVAIMQDKLFDFWWVALILQLLLIPAFMSRGDVYSFNGAQWSLFFEIAVNLVYAASVRWLTGKIMLGLLLLSGIGLFVVAHKWGNLGVGWGRSNFIGAGPRAVFGFLIGIFLWRMWESKRLKRVVLPWPLIAISVLLIIIAVSWGAASTRWYVDPLVVVFIMPPLVWLAACSPLVGRAARLGLVAGALSYPVYALQGPIRSGLTFAAGSPPVHDIMLVATMIATVILASLVALRFYDEPVRSYLRYALRKRRRLEADIA